MAPSSGRAEQDVMTSLVVFLIFTQIDKGGGAFTMLSRGQLYVTNAGDSIELDCEFHTSYFNLFDNPVLWIKHQYHEETRINIMGNINDPFVETRRFKVTFLPSSPRYRLILGIKELSLEDSGNYTCEVRGPSTTLKAYVTHRLFIRAPIEDIILNKDNCTDTESCGAHTPKHLTFTQNKESLLQCVATGGNPPPEVSVHLDNFDISYRFRSETYTRLLGSHGLRIMHSSVHTRTDSLVLDASDDGKILRCTATVPGLPPNVTTTVIRVHYAPVISCQPTAALDNQRNVYVSCKVTSRPRASTLFWVLDANGSTVTEGQLAGEFWTLVKDIDAGALETQLFMRRVKPSNFRHYSLVAENSVGTSREEVALIRKPHSGSGKNSDTPYYESRDYDSDGHQGGAERTHVDYIFIPAGAAHLTQNHITITILIYSTFQIIYLIL